MSIQNSAKGGDLEGVRRLLNGGTNVNDKDSYGETALHETARYTACSSFQSKSMVTLHTLVK